MFDWKASQNLLLLALFLVGEGCSERSITQENTNKTGTVVEMGTPENYCVVYCYIRIPFTIAQYDATHKTGRVFCDFDAEVTARLPIDKGVVRSKHIQGAPIGVFKNENGKATGNVELSTGIIKKYFVNAKVKNVHCHV